MNWLIIQMSCIGKKGDLMTKSKVILSIIFIASLLLVGTILLITVSANNPEGKFSRQLNLGNKYLDEEDYERAIAAFDKALDIDPKCVEAYRGKAEAYNALGKMDAAIDILVDGYKKTDANTMIDELQEIVLPYVTELISEGKKDEAIELIENIQTLIGDNIFDNLITEICPKYLLIKETNVFEGDRIGWWIQYEYDESGNRISMSYYDENGMQQPFHRYLYDEHGNCIKEEWLNSNEDIPVWTITYEYNMQDELVKLVSPSGSVAYSYEYDEYGNVIKENSIADSGEWGIHMYEYDENGNCIYERFRDSTYEEYGYDEDYFGWAKNVYDDKGRLIEYSFEGYRQEYEYDENGNMSRCYVYDEEEKKLWRYVIYEYEVF